MTNYLKLINWKIYIALRTTKILIKLMSEIITGESILKNEDSVDESNYQECYNFNNDLPQVDFNSIDFDDKESDEIDEFSSVTSKISSQENHEEGELSESVIHFGPNKQIIRDMCETENSEILNPTVPEQNIDYSYTNVYSIQTPSYLSWNPSEYSFQSYQPPQPELEAQRQEFFTDLWNKEPCWSRWTKLYEDSNKVWLCQVPPERRKKPLDITGWRHWGWKGWSQVTNSTRRRDLKKHRNNVWETDGNEIDKNGKNWSKKRKQLSELLSKVVFVDRSLLGFGIPFRSYSYIFGKTSSKNSENGNRKRSRRNKKGRGELKVEVKPQYCINNILLNDEFDGSTEVDDTASATNESTFEVKQEEPSLIKSENLNQENIN